MTQIVVTDSYANIDFGGTNNTPTANSIVYNSASSVPPGGSLPIGNNYGDYIIYNPGTSNWILGGYLGGGTNSNVSIGANAGGDGTVAVYGVAIGGGAGQTAQTYGAVAVGGLTGFLYQQPGTVALGYSAGYQYQQQGAIAIGSNAGVGDASGSSNDSIQQQCAIAIGANAGSNAQHQYAVALGYNAGQSNQGQYAIAIGAYAGQTNQNSNSIVINATGVELDGNANSNAGLYVAPINNSADGGNLTYNTETSEITYNPDGLSDYRLKTNIYDTTLGINFINQLRPVEFTWKDRISIGLDADGNALPQVDPGKRKHQGFIAQEVKQVLDYLSTDSALFTCINNVPSTISKTHKDKHGSTITTTYESPQAKLRGLYTLRHKELIAPTVKAVQEVYALTQTQQSTITLLEAQVSTLTAKLAIVCSTINIAI